MDVTATQRKQLKTWYLENHRKLPWRDTKDPYAIWLSEVMLQQTTVKAVIPYYEKFLIRFPTVIELASADLSEVYEYWAGLGYYSRARNLHKAAIYIAENSFPQTYETLLELPGFGPYTARAVASFAFNQNVGVVDGNVIRFLCRLFNLKIAWWENKQKNVLQDLADQFVKNEDASVVNQALIELGATICTSSSPACLICPMRKSCQSYLKKTQSQIPLKKPRKKNEVWIWYADVYRDKQNRLALIQNEYAPFLKGQFIFPGKVANPAKAPKIYNYKHNITHHEIYVVVQEKILDKKDSQSLRNKLQWHAKKDLKNITSFIDRKSSPVFNLVICVALSAIFTSCASTPSDSVTGVVYNKSEGEVHQLTFEGENTQSYFSPMNNKIIFIRKMASKETTQVFEKNLVDKKEKRITYNLGSNQSPQYHPFKAWIIYASTTDEQADDQQIGCRINNTYSPKVALSDISPCDNEPFEIYISSEDGSDLKRITKQKGADKLPVFSKDGGSFYYVHNAGKMNQIFQFNLSTGSQKIVYTTSEIIHDLSVSENLLAFSEGLGDTNQLKVLNLKKWDTVATLAKKSIEDVQLHPKEPLALISSKLNEGSSNIFLYNFKDNCLTQLSYGKSFDLDPSFGPGLKTYFFSSNRTGKYQIYSSFIREDLSCKKID